MYNITLTSMGSCQGKTRSTVVEICVIPQELHHKPKKSNLCTALGSRPNKPNCVKHSTCIYMTCNPAADLPSGIPTAV